MNDGNRKYTEKRKAMTLTEEKRETNERKGLNEKCLTTNMLYLGPAEHTLGLRDHKIQLRAPCFMMDEAGASVSAHSALPRQQGQITS